MDWLLSAPQIKSGFSSMGSMEGDTYVINPNALAILEEIHCQLIYEDQTLRTFRRAIGFGQNVRSDLIPLLENSKDDNILDAVIRILVNLTVPVECLFSVDVMYRTEVGRLTIFELNKLLYSSKEAFTDPKSTKSVVEYMKHILESANAPLSLQKCDSINNCLLLLRNILHIPETNVNFIITLPYSPGIRPTGVSMQNTILWNLFIQSIDKLLLYLMTCPQRGTWGVTMVQLIALIYKDQHVNTLQKLLTLWFEASLSESSEDNESNTSPPKQGSGDSSPMLTSDPTSDSSDNGSGGGNKKECSEDRRQALREETDATLQEVSRKGEEYKNLILMGVPMPFKVGGFGERGPPAIEPLDSYLNERSSSNTATAVAIAIAASATASKVVNLLNIYDHIMDTTGVVEPLIQQTIEELDEEKEQEDEAPMQKSNKTKPAETSTSTTDNESVFKSPPSPTDRKSRTEAAERANYDERPAKQCQKVRHSSKLNFTTGVSCPQKRECSSSQSELSDCGYGTQVENQESISTSSNDDEGPQSKPQHQKPPCNSKPRNKQRALLTVFDQKELRRKKLVKRSKSSLINMKGLVLRTPTDEDISNILKEFTVDFLLKGYGVLVEDIHSQLLSNVQLHIDSSHFFWLITYFLKFAAQLELDMEHINSILTYNLISFLTYEGVSLCEQLELNSRQEGSDLRPYLRRMHLVVTAIREFLQAIETYKKATHLSAEDRKHLRQLQTQIGSSEDLRCLFVLLLRRYNPSLHTKQYLQDLVVTNHILMLLLDSATNVENKVDMMDHLSQFATLEVMAYYGLLLEDFCSNGPFVNNCIFTMMHHVGGDLGQIGKLFQPVILKAFSRIWEADYELCDDWSDLIEYVIHKFINTPQKNPLAIPTTSLTELTKKHNLDTTLRTWTQEEMDTLYWYYVQSKKNNDVVGKIVKLFSKNGNKEKSRISIIQQLLQQDIITLVEYDDLMKFEDAEYQKTLLTTPSSASTESGVDLRNSISSGKPSDDIQILRDLIIKENKGKHLIWLQKTLLECCYIKLVFKDKPNSEDQKDLAYIMEPVAYHCILKNKPVPVVQWNNDQAVTMQYQPFVLLLHKLGFQLPADAGSFYARIPDFWTAETMFGLAKKLGPLENVHLKFDTTQFNDSSEAPHSSHNARASLSSISSIEVDISDNHDVLSHCAFDDYIDEKQPEKGNHQANSVFAMPKAKHTNSINGFTPDPMTTPTLPKWLQLVMRNKCSMAKATEEDQQESASHQTTDKYDTDVYMFSSGSGSSSHVLSNVVTTETPIMDPTTAPATGSRTTANNVIGLSTGVAATESVGYMNANTTTTQNVMDTETEAGDDADAASTAKGHTAGAYDMSSQQHQQMTTCHDDNDDVVDDDGAAKWLDRYDSNSSGVHTQSTASGALVDNDYSAMVDEVYKLERSDSETSIASDLTRMYVSDEEDRHETVMSPFHI